MSQAQPGLRRNANFNKLWAAQLISTTGISVTYISLPLLAIYTLDAGPFEVGLIAFAENLPYLLVTLWAGAWLDGRRRIPVMIATDFLRSAILIIIVALALVDLITIEMIIGLMVVFGVGNVLFEVSYHAAVPSIVHRSDLMAANSRLTTGYWISMLTGTNIGGVLTQLLTAPIALILDAVTYLISAVSLRWMRVDESAYLTVAAPTESRREQIWEGLRYVARHPLLRALTLSSAFYNFFTTAAMTIFPVFAVRSLELNAATIGFVQSFGGFGAIAGAFTSAYLIRKFGSGSTYIWAKALAWAGIFSIGLTPAHNPVTVTILVLAFSLTGMLVISNVVNITIRQAVTEDRMLGRMSATYKFVSFGSQAIGGFLAGLTGELLGLRAAMVLLGAALVSTVLVAIAPLRGLRELPIEAEAADSKPTGAEAADVKPTDARPTVTASGA